MAMNREQKRAMQRAGQGDGEGGAVQTRDRRQSQQQQRLKEDRTSPSQFMREVRSEMKKVAWPTREELIRYSIIVLITVVFMTTLVSVLDWGFLKFFNDVIFRTGTGSGVLNL